jgi:hypothetical protein
MLKNTSALRFAALGTLVLGFACAGFVANASADDVISNDAAKNITDATDAGHVSNAGTAPAAHGNAPGGAQSANGNNTGHGNAPGAAQANGGRNGHGPGGGIGSGGNPTGEGALLEGNCFADMPVYNKEGKYVGRGIVNTCN